MPEKLLLEALDLASQGRKTEARWLLLEVLRREPANETAWLWLADTAETVEERRSALESCLQHNPASQRARSELARLRIAAIAAETAQIPSTGSALRLPRRKASNEPPTVPLDLFAAARARAAAAWPSTHGAQVFTVSPEALTPEDFDQAEARTERFLKSRPDVRLLKAQIERRRRRGDNWNELSIPTEEVGHRAPRETTQPAARPARWRTLALYAAALLIFTALVLALSIALLQRGM